MPKLTKTSIAQATPGAAPYIIWDAQVKGLGMRVNPGSKKTFIFRYGKRTIAIGDVTMPLDAVREIALDMMIDVARGDDPAVKRQKKIKTPTVAKMMERYLEKHVRTTRSNSTYESFYSLTRKHILPAFGNKRITDINREDISALHGQLGNTPAMANRVVCVLSAAFKHAERWGWRPEHTNPCYLVEKYPENKRERYLSRDELRRLEHALTIMEQHPDGIHAVALVRLLIFTGARFSEIAHARWDDVDLIEGTLTVRDHKTKRKTGTKEITLNGPALDVLHNLPRKEGWEDWLIPGGIWNRPLVTMKVRWGRITRIAGIDNLRIHDLRHAFASAALSWAKLSLADVQALLHHSSSAMTERYAHLVGDVSRENSNRVGVVLREAMEGNRVEMKK